MRWNAALSFGEVHRFVGGLLEGELHAKRVQSLANATLGVVSTASLAVTTIGHGLALARRELPAAAHRAARRPVDGRRHGLGRHDRTEESCQPFLRTSPRCAQNT